MKRLYTLIAVALLLLGVTSSAGVIEIPSAQASGMTVLLATGGTPVGGGTPQTEDVYPTGDSVTSNVWTAQGAGDKYVEVDDTIGSHDSGSTYISISDDSTVVPAVQTFTYDSISITSSSITSVTVTAVWGETTGTSNLRAVLTVDGTVYQHATSERGDEWTEDTWTWVENPATSSAWTEADIEGSGANPLEEFGIKADGLSAGETTSATQVYMRVNYND